MHYVILRDDDTNALTPVSCLERLYRPLLDQGLPVNLATIPEVATDAAMANGRPEGFLLNRAAAAPVPVCGAGNRGGEQAEESAGTCDASRKPDATDHATQRTVALGENSELVSYLRQNPGYHIVQHGCHHNYHEFDCASRAELARRLEHGTQRLCEAGFPRPQTFVAPYDRLSRAGFQEASRRFRVLSTGWFELRRLPYSWWPRYAMKRLRRAAHWHVGPTLLLTHPGCLLSCNHTYSTMMGGIVHFLETQRLTVLVTHWWEYFRDGQPDNEFIDLLHETGAYLATHPNLKVISFDDLATGAYPLN